MAGFASSADDVVEESVAVVVVVVRFKENGGERVDRFSCPDMKILLCCLGGVIVDVAVANVSRDV
jgi:hypothetical protein